MGFLKNVLRRLLETLGVTAVSSGLITILLLTGKVRPTILAYFIVFSISALMFYGFNVAFLSKSLKNSEKLRDYFIVNFLVLLVMMIISVILRLFTSPNIYTAFFGFTKFIAKVESLGFEGSWIIFWVIYTIEILLMPLDRRYVTKKIDQYELE